VEKIGEKEGTKMVILNAHCDILRTCFWQLNVDDEDTDVAARVVTFPENNISDFFRNFSENFGKS